jgi:hypothetical protein
MALSFFTERGKKRGEGRREVGEFGRGDGRRGEALVGKRK